MTIAEWATSRTPRPPEALLEGVLAALGPDAQRTASDTADVCLSAAVRELERLLAAGRFQRDGALDLLTVDALVTYAYEYATTDAGCDVDRLAADAIVRLGTLVHVA